ncbi:hypothetical protein [Bdellovibrio sp. BCCA]|uniref:hypothetical protein n=1 Tax=Bdellovibrio sp. BCCA TaxID=3136281 RepID=UPI0030F10B18
MKVLDKNDKEITVGSHVKCLDALEHVSAGTVYKVEGVQPEALRVVVINDLGKEQWLRANRFVVATDLPVQLEFEWM